MKFQVVIEALADPTRREILTLLKDKEMMVTEAWNYMLKSIFALEDDQSLGLVERTFRVLEKVVEEPYLFVLFLVEKNKPNKVGELIREKEEKFIQLLRDLNPDKSEEKIQKLYITQMGIIAKGQLLSRQELENILG